MMWLLNGALEYFAMRFYIDASPTGFPFTPPAIRGRRHAGFPGGDFDWQFAGVRVEWAHVVA
jgi:hypothetical protein